MNRDFLLQKTLTTKASDAVWKVADSANSSQNNKGTRVGSTFIWATYPESRICTRGHWISSWKEIQEKRNSYLDWCYSYGLYSSTWTSSSNSPTLSTSFLKVSGRWLEPFYTNMQSCPSICHLYSTSSRGLSLLYKVWNITYPPFHHRWDWIGLSLEIRQPPSAASSWTLVDESEDLSNLEETLQNIIPEIGEPKRPPPQQLQEDQHHFTPSRRKSPKSRSLCPSFPPSPKLLEPSHQESRVLITSSGYLLEWSVRDISGSLQFRTSSSSFKFRTPCHSQITNQPVGGPS